MFLKQLRLYQYRNLENQDLLFHPRMNFFVGRNGQGKSNIVEAIHLVSSTRSFRSNVLQEVVRWSTQESSVFGQIENEHGSDELGVSLSHGRRQIYCNGDTIRNAQHYLTLFPTVTFVPQSVDLVFGPPNERRRLFDRYTSLLYPGGFEAFLKYKKFLQSKNALLKAKSHDRRQLDTLNELLADSAVIITHSRFQFLDLLIEEVKNTYSALAPEDKEVHLELYSSLLHKGASHCSRDEFLKVMSEQLPNEIRRGSTLVGPHLDDFLFFLGGKNARNFASQGQARSIALSVLIAIVSAIWTVHQKSPALLLDDFSSELDQERMIRFFKLLFNKNSQVFVTGTELVPIAKECSEYEIFEVKSGLVHPL